MRESVSIPSRRVGDFECGHDGSVYVEFPSPQGGSETELALRLDQVHGESFHPLKAGRRLSLPNPFALALVGFHPLKAGRRRLVEEAP